MFTGFTLSQTGMVRHHLRLREPGWRFGTAINGIGAATTGLIAAIVVISKFTEGAWIPAVLNPVMVVGFRAIGRARLPASLCERPDTERRTTTINAAPLDRPDASTTTRTARLAPDQRAERALRSLSPASLR